MPRSRTTETEPEPWTPPPPEPETTTGNRAMPEELTATADVFDNLDALRLKQDFNRAQIRKPFTSCPIRKPRKHEWFQSHPTYRFETRLFALREGMSIEWYLPIGAEVLTELDESSLYAVIIYVWVNRKSDLAIWPVPLFDADGRDNDWWVSLREVMTHHAAQGQWVRMSGGNQAYDIQIAENEALPTPKWPEVDLKTILRTAFKGGRVIDSLDHPIIQSLRGRV